MQQSRFKQFEHYDPTYIIYASDGKTPLLYCLKWNLVSNKPKARKMRKYSRAMWNKKYPGIRFGGYMLNPVYSFHRDISSSPVYNAYRNTVFQQESITHEQWQRFKHKFQTYVSNTSY